MTSSKNESSTAGQQEMTDASFMSFFDSRDRLYELDEMLDEVPSSILSDEQKLAMFVEMKFWFIDRYLFLLHHPGTTTAEGEKDASRMVAMVTERFQKRIGLLQTGAPSLDYQI